MMPEEDPKKLTTDYTHETAEFDTRPPEGGTPIDAANLPGIKVRKKPEKSPMQERPDWDVRGGKFEGPSGGAGGTPESLEEQIKEESREK